MFSGLSTSVLDNRFRVENPVCVRNYGGSGLTDVQTLLVASDEEGSDSVDRVDCYWVPVPDELDVLF